MRYRVQRGSFCKHLKVSTTSAIWYGQGCTICKVQRGRSSWRTSGKALCSQVGRYRCTYGQWKRRKNQILCHCLEEEDSSDSRVLRRACLVSVCLENGAPRIPARKSASPPMVRVTEGPTPVAGVVAGAVSPPVPPPAPTAPIEGSTVGVAPDPHVARSSSAAEGARRARHRSREPAVLGWVAGNRSRKK